jgi:hypothetical protein
MSPTLSSTTAVCNWSPALVPGPEWRSFEQFRTVGPTALEGIIPLGCIATLRVKTNTFRIMRDEDFQKLIGLATEVNRLKGGLTVVLSVAKIVAKYPNDPDGLQALCHSISLLNESTLLPERAGHEGFRITPEEVKEFGKEDFDLSTLHIPRPIL